MTTVAEATRPVTAEPPARERHGICRLTLRIGGTDYTLRPIPATKPELAAWRVTKQDPERSGYYVVIATKGKPHSCTCPDHTRSGWTCKHINALQALNLIPAPKPAKPSKAHGRNARQAIAEARQLTTQQRNHLAETAPPRPAPILEEGWQPGGDYARFKADFNKAVGAHVNRIRTGFIACVACGCDFDPEDSGHHSLCITCAREEYES